MGSKQQPALRPSSTDGGCGGDHGRAASVRERSSVTNASFRVYYSLRAGAVPFLWESAPGTPKRGAAAVSPESSLPATTATSSGAGGATLLPPPPSPPPSYQSPFHGKGRKPSWAAAAGDIVRALLGVLRLRKSHRRSRRRPDMPCI
ncbi:hypothetical protein CFC21_068486 [Triticum aestivum]|uniref:Uncharacterized protein n=3 Tax=Triticum TaxID=4564 RepID=A0A9R0WV38_TRITD|nr:uncharacterized protein LOC123108178 [Triticum aestivum]XP_048527056.1 uncharacterized protein LOC125506243 [Triticum urartu]KAF7061822.1 hypothetical protein CFC21_068486 [Triticum aestivum]VAI24026.1 unnamed protein product [Triticum turgidum subsp. durum]